MSQIDPVMGCCECGMPLHDSDWSLQHKAYICPDCGAGNDCDGGQE